MFEAESRDIKLTKVRSFGEIGKTDTLRVFEPTASFAGKAYKDDEAKQQGISAEIRKNTFVVIGGDAIELPKGINILDYINVPEYKKVEKAFLELMGLDDEAEKNPK